MTEIKLTLDDPHSTIASLREGASDLAPFGQKQVYEVVRQIEEQVKPVIEEPTEWGSIVRARRVGYGAEDTITLRWQRANTQDANDSWTSEPAGDLGIRYSSHWSYLTDVEVLRVGIGEAP